MIFVMSLNLSDTKVLQNMASSSSFFQFRWDFLAFFARILYLKFFEFRNLIKKLFHSRLLDMRLVIANSALRASLAIYISYPTRAHGIIVKYHAKTELNNCLLYILHMIHSLKQKRGVQPFCF